MKTKVPEKLRKVIAEIDAQGNASLTKLTVLKKWFEPPGRLSVFALWVAVRAVSHKAKKEGQAAELFREAEALLSDLDLSKPELRRGAAQSLHSRLRNFQNEYQNQQWATVRIVHHWDLMLVEEGLAIHLWHADSPSRGYKLAADYCQHYDSRYGNGLNGPSRAKIEEMIQFMIGVEAKEDA